MGSMSIFHWLLVFLVFSLFFGTERLARMGKDWGTAVRRFKEGFNEGSDSAQAEKTSSVDKDHH